MSNDRSTYRANRRTDQDPTLLERYGERHIVSFFRYNMQEIAPGTDTPNPNYDFGKEVEAANLLDEKIRFFDNNEALLHQVIFGIQYPDLCHPGVRDFIGDRQLVALLLVRHFKKSGGFMLPPMDGAQQLSEAHAARVRIDMAAGLQPTPMRYPMWRPVETTAPASSTPVAPGSASATLGGRDRGAGGRGGRAPRGGYGGN